MLESLPRLSYSKRVMRLANPRNDIAALEGLGMSDAGTADILGLLKTRANPGGLDVLVESSFDEWNKYGPPFGWPTRFSSGEWPVLYAALDKGTAEDEIRYHRGRDLLTLTVPRRFFYRLIELEYCGITIDLGMQTTVWPALTDPEPTTAYPFCQELGREGSAEGIAGFLTVSARRAGGINVPVFRREALSGPKDMGVAAFTPDPSMGIVEVSWGR